MYKRSDCPAVGNIDATNLKKSIFKMSTCVEITQYYNTTNRRSGTHAINVIAGEATWGTQYLYNIEINYITEE